MATQWLSSPYYGSITDCNMPIYESSLVISCIMLPFDDGWVPVLDFYTQGFSSFDIFISG